MKHPVIAGYIQLSKMCVADYVTLAHCLKAESVLTIPEDVEDEQSYERLAHLGLLEQVKIVKGDDHRVGKVAYAPSEDALGFMMWLDSQLITPVE